MKFELTEAQEKRWEEWKGSLPELPKGYFGAAGGGYWFKFIPTGLGTIIEAGRDDDPKHDISLTDFLNW